MDMKTFCYRQVEEAKKYKWIQSQKAGKELGNEAITEWVSKFAAKFRKEYNDIYAAMVQHVTAETIKELEKKGIKYDEKMVQTIVNISICKFTEKWTTDISDEKHDIHLDML